MSKRRSRRSLLRAGVAAAVVGTAGCLDAIEDGIDSTPGAGDTAWSQYRGGPENRGTSDDSGPGADPEIEWSWQADSPEVDEADMLMGTQINGPVIVGEHAYVTTPYQYGDADDGFDEGFTLFAVDLETGETESRVELPHEGTDIPPYPLATDGDYVYCYTAHRDAVELLAVDLDAGKLAFEVEPEYTLSTGFTLADDVLYFGGGTVHARESAGGESKWDLELEDRSDRPRRTTQIIPPTVTDDVVYAGVHAELVAVDRASGEENWRVEVGHEDRIYRDGHPTQVYPPVLVGESLYLTSGEPFQLSDGALIALDPADGSEQWRYQPPKGEAGDPEGMEPGAIYGVPTPGDDALFAVGIEEGDRKLFAVGQDGELDWSTPTEWLSISPVLVDGLLYLPAGEGVAVFDATDGERLAEVNLPADPTPGAYESPAVVGDRLLVPTREGLVSIRGN